MPDRGPQLDSFGARARRSLAGRLRSVAVWSGALSYRPVWVPSPDEWERQYAGGDWDYLGDLDELARYSLVEGYIRRFGGADGGSVLDLGCGAGLLREQIEHVPFQRYVGVDPVSEAIDRARVLEDDRTSFLCGDAFCDELVEFDVVVASEMLYMVDDPPAVLGRIIELLGTNGHLVCSNFRHTGDSGLHRMLDRQLRLVDEVEVRHRGGSRRSRRWRVSCHALPVDPPRS